MKRISVKHAVALGVILIFLLVAAPWAVRYYRFAASHVSTDDAYVEGPIVLISPRVPGIVTKVYVQDNWLVKAGDPLLTLDPTDYEVKVEQARARLDRARLQVDQQFAELQAAQANLRLVQDQMAQEQRDFQFAQTQEAKGKSSQQAFEQAELSYRAAQTNVALAQASVARVRAALGGDVEDHSRYDLPAVKEAEAELKEAELELSYTAVAAPLAGAITRLNTHVGRHVQAGEPLLSIVPLQGLFVIANFKETQLTDVRVGQPAEVTADVYPDYVFRGHVDSISLGTGAAFSLLPPENATGNWVKVVQRVPVKIIFDTPPPPDKQLRVGLSVEASVNISDVHGPVVSALTQKRAVGATESLPQAAPAP
jgi:membrane fusion protein (multidrug efflux system)